MAQKEKLEEAKRLYQTANADQRYVLESLFPELKESEDERIRKELIFYLRYQHSISENFEDIGKWIAWLEKQGKHSIYNVPSREVILAIWDLENEWKELTNGSISTEYGTQLDYIQKHWHESEYYLREKQGWQKPTDKDMVEALRTEYEKGRANTIAEIQKPEWSEEDEDLLTWSLNNLTELEQRYGEGYGKVKKCINWIKSLKQRIIGG